MLKDKLDILYISCNEFMGLWDSFIKQKEKYLCKDELKMYIGTDIINKEIKFENVEIIEYGKESDLLNNYYDRILYYLNKLEKEYILYFCDDMHLCSKVSLDKLNDFIEIMESNKNIKIIKLSTQSHNFVYGRNIIINNYKFKKAENKKDKLIFNVQPILIRRDFYINMIIFCKKFGKKNINQHTLTEIEGTHYILQNPKFICLRVEEDFFNIFNERGLLIGGFLNKNIDKELLKREEINLIFDKNGKIKKL